MKNIRKYFPFTFFLHNFDNITTVGINVCINIFGHPFANVIYFDIVERLYKGVLINADVYTFNLINDITLNSL